MYYKSRKNSIKKWLFNSNSKIYMPILLLLCVLIYFTFKNINGSYQEVYSDENDTVEATESETESPTSLVTNDNSYLIKVNKSNNFITVYKKDSNNDYTVAYKTFRCSVNANVPTGSSKILEKFVWRMLDSNQYAQYTSKIGATIYIHSVPYSSDKNSSLITDAYNNLGNTAKIGSIYLSVADSKWIYENCKNDTDVEVYEDAAETPAIALADKVTLPFGTGYDPTDLEASNKVVQKKIDYLKGVKDKEVALGSSINLWEGIYAVDVEGNDITSYVSISGSVNTSEAGRYTVTYNLMDTFGTVIAYNSIITVY